VNRDQDNDRSTKRDQDVSNLLVGQSAGGKIVLRLVGPGGEPCQFLVIERRNGLFDLDRIKVGRLQRLISLLG